MRDWHNPQSTTPAFTCLDDFVPADDALRIIKQIVGSGPDRPSDRFDMVCLKFSRASIFLHRLIRGPTMNLEQREDKRQRQRK